MFENVAQTGPVFAANGEPDLSRTDSSAKTARYRALVLNLAMAIITRNATPAAHAIPVTSIGQRAIGGALPTGIVGSDQSIPSFDFLAYGSVIQAPPRSVNVASVPNLLNAADADR